MCVCGVFWVGGAVLLKPGMCLASGGAASAKLRLDVSAHLLSFLQSAAERQGGGGGSRRGEVSPSLAEEAAAAPAAAAAAGIRCQRSHVRGSDAQVLLRTG